MKRLFTVVVVGGFMLTAGCAMKPVDIPAASVPKALYSNMACIQLESEIRTHHSRLEELNKKQVSARKSDILINTFGLPGFGAVTADHEEEISVTKGKISAMDAEHTRRCVKA